MSDSFQIRFWLYTLAPEHEILFPYKLSYLEIYNVFIPHWYYQFYSPSKTISLVFQCLKLPFPTLYLTSNLCRDTLKPCKHPLKISIDLWNTEANQMIVHYDDNKMLISPHHNTYCSFLYVSVRHSILRKSSPFHPSILLYYRNYEFLFIKWVYSYYLYHWCSNSFRFGPPNPIFFQ